jgi:hypothetical protein
MFHWRIEPKPLWADGLPPAAVPAPIVERWRAAGWASTGDRIRLTPEGWLRLDALVASLP